MRSKGWWGSTEFNMFRNEETSEVGPGTTGSGTIYRLVSNLVERTKDSEKDFVTRTFTKLTQTNKLSKW